MRYGFRFGFALALGLALLAGCSDENGEGGTGGTGGVSTVEKILLVWEYSPRPGLAGPLPGVKVCAIDTDDCVWTNEEGRAVVEIPFDREFSFTLEKEGYGQEVIADFQPEGLFLNPLNAIQEEGAFYTLYERVGSPYPMAGTGTVIVIPLDGAFSNLSIGCKGVAGRTFELHGASGKGYYHDEQGYWDASLTATSCWGWGGFTEVPPGEVQIEIGGNAENCQVLHGWPGTVENSVRMPVRVGHMTEVWVDCGVSD